MSKININKEDIKELVNESLKMILKEYNNYDLKNEVKYCKSVYKKISDFLDYLEVAHIDDFVDMKEKDPALFNLISCVDKLYYAFIDFFKERKIY